MKVFIAGSRKIARLNNVLMERLDKIIKSGHSVLVGDANGVDKIVQKYLFEQKYRDVFVFCVGSICRNNIGHWEVKNINEPSRIKNFEYFATKDLQMAKEADYGLMIWDSKSKGTLNNILNLLKRDKMVVVYFSTEKKFYNLSSLDEFEKLAFEHNGNHLEFKEGMARFFKNHQEEQKELDFA